MGSYDTYVDAELKLEEDSSAFKPAYPHETREALESMGRFMSETSLTGGIAKTREEFFGQVQESLRSNDAGALLFWERNLRKILKGFPVDVRDPARDLKLNEQIEAFVEKKLDVKRTVSAKESARKLRGLREMKETVDSIIRDAHSVLVMNDGHLISNQFKPNLKQRTEQQRKIAARKADIRRAQADLHELKRFPGSGGHPEGCGF